MSPPRTIWTGHLGKVDLAIVVKDGLYYGKANGVVVVKDATTEDDVRRRLAGEAGKGSARYIDYPGAINRFTHFFPNGFGSDCYRRMERDYKLKARDILQAKAPLEKAANGSGLGEAVLAVYQTNLLSPFEKMRLRDALHSPDADAFIRAAARFTLGEGKAALRDMEAALKPHDAAKWTIVTYLPFLWRPHEHMYLKPEATKDFAERVGHPFHAVYEARLDLAVYDSLLDLTAKTEREIAGLKPADRIDVQSFIWVVGDYDEKTEQPCP